MNRLLVALALLLPISSAAADELTPAARAKAAVDAQVATFRRGLAGVPTFLAMFDGGGVVVGDGGVMKASDLAAALTHPYVPGDNESYETHALLARVFGATPDGATDQTLKKVTVGKVTAGGTADAVWFTVDITENDVATITYRVSELLVDRGGWKIAVAHLGVARNDSWEPEEESEGDGPTHWGPFPEPDADTGSLAMLATSPRAAAAALGKGPGVFVLGTGPKDRALGSAAAGKLLRRWGKLALEDVDSVEVEGKTWAYAVTQVVLPGKPGFSMKMRATLFAIPAAAGGWQVVGVQYSRVHW